MARVGFKIDFRPIIGEKVLTLGDDDEGEEGELKVGGLVMGRWLIA